ncbi:RNA degradosome polyphosphate kinase [Poseidonocella sp. HB161398]|uniref:RNA degradosome polyphosphate kinase n=1 Tax=Poseidonocella sp. HB161398 TaxID=2320855 RepID=UPI001109F046|nr:RNA degradosome polyphosphate kinase [Poseidonocella sp. HB161398]
MNTADFLNADFPEPAELAGFDPELPQRFSNRELSWLAFNWRVLEEADNPTVPLLERLRFVSISANNLDEFYTVRVAGLRELANSGITTPAADGRTPAEQLALIDADARALMQEQQRCWNKLRQEMEAEGIVVVGRKGLNAADRTMMEQHFLSQVFPVLTPLAVDPAHPFPFIPSAGFALALMLERRGDRRHLRALLPVPGQVPRFLPLPPDRTRRQRFLPLEELLLMHVEHLFPGYDLIGDCAFRILRNSDLEVEEEAEDLVREFEVALKRRRRGEVIRMKISGGAPEELRRMILGELGLRNDEVVDIKGMIGVVDLKELVLDNRPDLMWPSYTPRVPERVQDFDGDIFGAVRQKDMLLHHPYESFDMVVRFLQQAARDPDVLAIKQTLYRTSKDSPIVAALCEAAEDGKSVTALVELKARFDEAANIRQSRMLERAGVHVVYGFTNYKTHAKISSVVRRENGRLVTYSHYGTGNYHPITARIYTDVSLLTCDEALGRDATRVFNYLSGYAKPDTLENLKISPHTMKPFLLEALEREALHAAQGRPAEVWAKLNAVIDPEVVDALYRASQAGVKVSLVVRGICGVRPGIKGLSENIRVKSIVGRFLEHSRIVCFGNGGGLPSDAARVFISSADWMGRNLNRRVETLVEIHNDTVRDQIVQQIMAANLRDEAHSWVLTPEGRYVRPEAAQQPSAFSCHDFFMKTPSLSGRGSAGIGDVPQLTLPQEIRPGNDPDRAPLARD